MDERKNLILIKGENKTRQITWCHYDSQSQRYKVTFSDGKTYPYAYSSVRWLKDPVERKPYASLSVICHQRLRLLLRNYDKLTNEEYRYATHPNTHVDFLIYNCITKIPLLAIEVDGFNYHKENTRQAERDRMKDTIFMKYGIPLLRLSTNGSEEIQKIKNMLKTVISS